MMFRLYRGNIKGLIFIIAFRIAHFFSKNKLLHVIGFPIWMTYRLVFNWILGIDIPESASIGKNFVVWHGIGIVVHPLVVIGDNVSIRQNTTIGNKQTGGKVPLIGNDVVIGPNCVILGDITIGNHAVIGAGSVVIHDVPENAVVAGNPAQIKNK